MAWRPGPEESPDRMFFNSVPFALFFPVFFVSYWLLARHRRARHLLILAGSYFFYGWWDWRFLGLILVSTLVDYQAGLLLVQTEHPRKRRLLVACSLAANLGILGFFKYFNFFSESAARLLGDLGLHVDPFVLALVLPPGISFYTFQTLSYTLDIYRKKLEPTRSFL
ncbi:MAG: MBOAT family protein, partial [Planctomycetota bacterium]